jgi:hypothetical protein
MFISGDMMTTVPSAKPEVVFVLSRNGDILEVGSRDGWQGFSGYRGFSRLQQPQQQLL